MYRKDEASTPIVSVRIESINIVDKEIAISGRWIPLPGHSTDRCAPKRELGTDITKAKDGYPNIDPAVLRKMAYDALAQIKI